MLHHFIHDKTYHGYNDYKINHLENSNFPLLLNVYRKAYYLT